VRRRLRDQKGSLYQEHGRWRLRYYEDRVVDEQLQRQKLNRDLGPTTGTERLSAKRAREVADEFLRTVNATARSGDGTRAVTLDAFVDRVYFAEYAEQQLRPSTVKGYRNLWAQLKPYCAGLWLREIDTCDMQTVLNSLARTGRFNKNSLKHAKSFLSGVFKQAIQRRYSPAMYNPLEQTSIPKARACGDAYAYSLEEIDAMLTVLPEPAATIVATAAFTGARRGEIRAMTWENYDGAQLLIAQSNWQGHITDPKTKKSKARIPIIKQLALRLGIHREQQGNSKTGPIFRTAANTAQDLDSVLRRIILPVLNRCGVCEKAEPEHSLDAGHKYERDVAMPRWRGWHGFRRGLATNLYRLGVPDKTIQAILRHSNLATTQNIYIQNVPADARSAMERLEAELAVRSALSARKRPAPGPARNQPLPN